MRIPYCFLIMVAGCLTLRAVSNAQSYSFYRVGLLPGETSMVSTAMSGDGSTVVGYALGNTPAADMAWKWTQNAGLEVLPVPSKYHGYPAGISADASVISGTAVASSTGSGICLWNTQGSFAFVANDPLNHSARISSDGNIVYGQHGSNAYRWSAQTGLIDLPAAYDMLGSDAAGSTLVGYKPYGYFGTDGHSYSTFLPLIWTADTGVTRLQDRGHDFYGSLFAISDDARIIMGLTADQYGNSGGAFYWTAAGGVVSINLPNAVPVMSGNGDVFGAGNMLWDRTTNTYTTISHTGWASLVITGMNSTGSVVTGTGVFQGREESWVVTIPAPGAAVPFACAAFGLLRRRRSL